MIKAKNRRTKCGMALVSLIVLGAFAIAIMMAIFQLALNVTRSEASSKLSAELRNALESGLDYGVQQANNSLVTGDPVLFYNTVQDVPNAYLPDGFNGKVRLTMRDMSSSEWELFSRYGVSYSLELDPAMGPNGGDVTSRTSNNLTRTNIRTNYYRVIDVAAKEGSFSRGLRVILEPRFDIAPGEMALRVSGSSNSSYFSNIAFGNSLVNVSAPTSTNLTIGGSDGVIGDPGAKEFALKLQSNRLAQIGNGLTLNGDLKISNNLSDGGTAVAQVSDSNFSIKGRLLSNSPVSSDFVSTSGPTVSSGDNVTAQADSVAAGSPVNRSGDNLNPEVVLDSSSYQQQVAPAPVPNDVSAKALTLGSSSSLSSGSYSTPSLDTSSISPVSITGTSPVKIFIQDGTSTGEAATISSSKFTNSGSAERLQIWYEGTRPINLKLDSSFNGVIYAPNAPINLTGNGIFTGALVGDKLNLANSGTINFQTNLSQGAAAASSGAGAVSYSSNGVEPVLQGYKPVSWQEFNHALLDVN